MKNPLIMTPGPTYVHEEVRRALSLEITNPDLDEKFFEMYKETCNKIKRVLNTDNDTLILCGEGILGLEAACASIIVPGDRILCIDNGIFGNGFGDFAKMYGGIVEYFKSDYQSGIDINALKQFLEGDHNFKAATMVHCETPSGITNPVDLICPLLKSYGILTIVDSVSAIGGEKLMVDEWRMDIVLGGSQKCLSAPPGLTFLSISEAAWQSIMNRKIPIVGYYSNLSLWKNWYAEKWFPYTQPISDIYGLNVALERWLQQQDPIKRHENIAKAVREAFESAGINLYPQNSYSNTVTTILIPTGITFKELFDDMLNKHNVLIGGAFGYLKDKVFRIGHMGENCYEEKIFVVLKALDEVFISKSIDRNGLLYHHFINALNPDKN